VPPVTKDPTSRPPGTVSAVLRFMLGSLAAIAVVVVGGYLALRSVTIDEAERDTRERVVTEARLARATGLTDGLVRGDRAAIARLDAVVRGQLLSPSVVRIKVWAADGTVVYSDEPRLIGRRFPLEEEERELFEHGGAEAELSDLGAAENRFERSAGRLLEAHTVVRLPDGTPVLFEIYQRFSAVTGNAQRLLRALAPPLLGGLLVLLLVQAPLAWSMARRLRRGHREREALLSSAVEASSQERRRIAADLHDGVVQDLAGVAFGLAPLVERAERDGDPETAAALRDSVDHLRQGVRDLRTLLVEIHPPSVARTGLEAPLADLLSPLRAAGIATTLELDDAVAAGTRHDELLYRAAREAVRNARQHGEPTSVEVLVAGTTDGGVRLRVVDDGRGFDHAEGARRRAEGHVGLELLEGLVAQAGGSLRVAGWPGRGTVVELELPV
jgi:two-component system NarL family sensor kinase